MTPKEANILVGGLSDTSKMPCKSYNLPTRYCKVGNQLMNIKNSVCSDCYACKGHYGFDVVQNALERRYKAMNNPNWTNAMVLLISKMPFFRWHDRGDLQGLRHLDSINNICFRTPKTKHWLPTREWKLVTDYIEKIGCTISSNLCIRLSGLMIDGKAPYALAQRLGVQVSEVGKHKLRITCPAHLQDNKCKDCRKCWDKRELNVVYKWH